MKAVPLALVIFLVSLEFCSVQLSVCSTIDEAHECRLWGAVSDLIPSPVLWDHLVSMPYSLKSLGAYNRNGWALACFNAIPGCLVTRRGSLPANEDPSFDSAVGAIASSGPQIVVGHVRTATSGLSDIPDPHPFNRSRNGKWWIFAHNGGVSKSILIELMGIEYLNQNPPQVGNSSDQWVDSEIFFIYVMKCIEEQNWNVTLGMKVAATTIYQKNSFAIMNFLLSDGDSLWGFCKGYGLFYRYNPSDETTPQWTVIASQPPTSSYAGWVLLNDFDLIEASKERQPAILDVRSITMPEHPLPSLPGDVNDDGKVELRDLFMMFKAFGSTPSKPNWDIRADIARPYNLIDTKDLFEVVRNFGQPKP